LTLDFHFVGFLLQVGLVFGNFFYSYFFSSAVLFFFFPTIVFASMNKIAALIDCVGELLVAYGDCESALHTFFLAVCNLVFLIFLVSSSFFNFSTHFAFLFFFVTPILHSCCSSFSCWDDWEGLFLASKLVLPTVGSGRETTTRPQPWFLSLVLCSVACKTLHGLGDTLKVFVI
jgi:hypothetical protein